MLHGGARARDSGADADNREGGREGSEGPPLEQLNL